MTEAPYTVTPEPLSPEAFALFGDVAERPIEQRRRYLPTSLDRADDAKTFSLWISNAATVGVLPLRLVTLERHPYSAQTFIPLGTGRYLVIVCKPDPDGHPDLATLRCFIAGAQQSVTFGRNVWHHPMTVLDHSMEFAVAMGMTGRQDDDVFVTIDAIVNIEYREAANPVEIASMTQQKDHLERDFVGYGRTPPNPKWPGAARIALNFCINYEEGSEPSFPDGDGFSETALTEGGAGGFEGRDLAAESMFEYGSRIGFWRILRMLSERGMTATVMGCALALERNDEACSAIREHGYDVCAHGWRWERHQLLNEADERERIRKTVESLARTIGERPLGWYCRYGPSINTRRLVVEEGGFLYDSDAYNDELPYWTRVAGRSHLVVPYGLTNNDAKFSRGAMATANDFFEYLRDAFDLLYAEGATAPKMMSVGLHTRIIGHPGRAAGLQRFLDHVAKHPSVWVCRRADIARHWHATHPATL